MGTDYLQLLDRRTAEIIIRGEGSDLAALVDLRTTAYIPPVWKQYWDADQQRLTNFDSLVTAAERFKVLIETGSTIEEIKEELLHELCVSHWLYIDYWGCSSEVFNGSPPGAITWEEFAAPIYSAASQPKQEAVGSSGCYLLTHENIDSILKSLEFHRHELEIMDGPKIDRLRSWQNLCRKHPGFSILYQIDF